MVRFKNRYFLVELIPFAVEDSISSSDLASKGNNRYHFSKNSEQLNDFLSKLPPISSASVSSFIRNSVAINYGQFASASLLQSLSVKYTNYSTKMIILRVPREFQPKIWASLSYITDWPAENQNSPTFVKCTWRVVHCSGTIRSCQKSAILFAKKAIRDSYGTSDCVRPHDEDLLEPLAKKIRSMDP